MSLIQSYRLRRRPLQRNPPNDTQSALLTRRLLLRASTSVTSLWSKPRLYIRLACRYLSLLLRYITSVTTVSDADRPLQLTDGVINRLMPFVIRLTTTGLLAGQSTSSAQLIASRTHDVGFRNGLFNDACLLSCLFLTFDLFSRLAMFLVGLLLQHYASFEYTMTLNYAAINFVALIIWLSWTTNFMACALATTMLLLFVTGWSEAMITKLRTGKNIVRRQIPDNHPLTSPPDIRNWARPTNKNHRLAVISLLPNFAEQSRLDAHRGCKREKRLGSGDWLPFSDVVSASSLNTFKERLDKYWGHHCYSLDPSLFVRRQVNSQQVTLA